jgi:hypothetical protein
VGAALTTERPAPAPSKPKLVEVAHALRRGSDPPRSLCGLRLSGPLAPPGTARCRVCELLCAGPGPVDPAFN